MLIKEKGIFAEILPVFQSGILTTTTRSESTHNIYLMNRDDYFNQSKIDFSKAINKQENVLNSYMESQCFSKPLVVVIKNDCDKPIEVSLTLEHTEQRRIFASAFSGTNPFAEL